MNLNSQRWSPAWVIWEISDKDYLIMENTTINPEADVGDSARVGRLRCEGLENPLGIDEARPRLSWKLADPRRGARQTAYRVLVASTPAKLAADVGDLWDSGRIESDQSHLVPYAGKPLASGQIVNWKVKVWDKDGRESPWSEPARWEMGLLNPQDWKAMPIAGTPPNVIADTDWMDFLDVIPNIPEKMATNRSNIQERILPVSLYGKDFTVEELPERARLYVTAHGNSYFAVYLNGQRVGDEERMPAPTFNDPLVSYYSVYDVTALLRQGENRLRCLNWSDSRHSKVPCPHEPSVTMQINGVANGENAVLVATDLTWRQRSSPYVALGDGTIFEYYDFRIPDPTLALESVTDPDWVPVKRGEVEEPTFARSIVPLERVMRRVTPVAVLSPAPGVYTFDLGEIITGNFEWKVPDNLPAGSRIIFRESCILQTREGDWMERGVYYPPEIQITDGSKRLSHYHHQNLCHFIPTVVYIAGENPPPAWRTILDNRLFRYVEVIGLKHPPKPEDLIGLQIYTDCPRVGYFESSEPDFNTFHEMCANTMSMNQHGIMTDCWDREREPYNGSWPKKQFMRCVYDIDPLIRNHITENIKTVMRLGYCAIESYAHSTPEQQNREKPNVVWPGNLVYEPQVACQLGGDSRIMEEGFDAILKHIRYYRDRIDINGSIRDVELYNDFGDWLGYCNHFYSGWLKDQEQSFEEDIARCWFGNIPMPRRELYLLGRGVLCDMAGVAARWADELGRKEEGVELQQFHESLKSAIHKVCFNEEKLSYGRFPEIMPLGADTLDAWALFTCIPPTPLRRDIMRRMVRELRGRGHFITTGVITSLAYLRLLADYGYADDAYAVYTREDFPSIRHYMRRLCGPGAIRENYHVRESHSAASYCHGDFTQLADWFWYGLGGLRPDENHPGLKHFTLAPQIPTKMAWAKIAHESPYGTIVSSWKQADGKAVWEVTVPPNSTATAMIPASDAAAIREGGKTLAEAGLAAEPGPHGTTRCELAPGSYWFEFQAVNQSMNPL